MAGKPRHASLLLCTLLLSQARAFFHAEPDEVVSIRSFLEIFDLHGGREFARRLLEEEPIEAQDFKDLDDMFGIECLLTTIRVNKYPITPAYTVNQVCLSEEDEPDAKAKYPCSEDNLIQFTDKLDASGNEFRYLNGDSGQSQSILGTFWLDVRSLNG